MKPEFGQQHGVSPFPLPIEMALTLAAQQSGVTVTADCSPVTIYQLPLTTYQQFVVTGYCHRQHFQLGFLRMYQRDVLGNNSPFQQKLQMSIYLGFCFSRGYALKRF